MSVRAPDGALTRYAYDRVGQIIRRTDANSRVTAYAYDAARRLSRAMQPLNRVWSYNYDANGNRTQTIDAIGCATADPTDWVTTYIYDALNRLVRIGYSDATPTSSSPMMAIAIA